MIPARRSLPYAELTGPSNVSREWRSARLSPDGQLSTSSLRSASSSWRSCWFQSSLSFFASIKTSVEASAVPAALFAIAASVSRTTSGFSTIRRDCRPMSSTALAVALLTIALWLFLAVPAGYGLACFTVPGKEVMFLVLLLSLMMPYQALLTPLYRLFASMGLANTYLGLAIIHALLQLPFSVYLMRNTFEAVPKELAEASLMDGASNHPNSVADISARSAAVDRHPALFAFITSWNEFLAALIVMNRETAFTVPVMLVGVRRATSARSTGARCRRASSSRSSRASRFTCSCRNTTSRAS